MKKYARRALFFTINELESQGIFFHNCTPQNQLHTESFSHHAVIVAKQNTINQSWGVAPASQHQEILVALASLIRAQRYEMALTILDNELGGGS